MKGILRPERELSCQSVNSSKIDVIKHKTNCFQSCIEKCVKTNNQENAHRRNNVCSFRDCLTKHSIQQIIQRRMSGWRVNSSLEGTWKETVDYFEGFSLNQSDQSVTEPRSESGYFRLLSGTIANASTGTSGQMNVTEQKVILGYGIETERPADNHSVWLKAGICLLSKTRGKGQKRPPLSP